MEILCIAWKSKEIQGTPRNPWEIQGKPRENIINDPMVDPARSGGNARPTRLSPPGPARPPNKLYSVGTILSPRSVPSVGRAGHTAMTVAVIGRASNLRVF